METYILFVWIFPSVFTGFLARKQGRNIPLGAILGFLFSWFTFIIYLMIGDSYETRIRRAHEINRELNKKYRVKH